MQIVMMVKKSSLAKIWMCATVFGVIAGGNAGLKVERDLCLEKYEWVGESIVHVHR